MTRWSQRDNGLIDTNVDISVVERSLCRARNKAAPTEPIRAQMEQGQGSGEGNTTHLNPDNCSDVMNYDIERLESPLPALPKSMDPLARFETAELFSYFMERRKDYKFQMPDICVDDPLRLNDGILEALRAIIFRDERQGDPLEHLREFERICNKYLVDKIPIDDMRMIMFPFSLLGAAGYWEKDMPTNMVNTWGAIKREFLIAFYPKAKGRSFKENIVNFKQGSTKTLSQALSRIVSYSKDFPHHGLSKGEVIKSF